MIPNDAPSALRLFNLGPSMAARSQSASCLVLRAARSPGVAVRVPSKSKKITATPAAGSTRKSSRKGLGDSGPGRDQAGIWGKMKPPLFSWEMCWGKMKEQNLMMSVRVKMGDTPLQFI